MKRGYIAEWEVKTKLAKKYPKEAIWKVAIGGAVDFLILGKSGKIEKIVEVKKTNKKTWYPSLHDWKQFKILNKIQKKFQIPVEYWIKIKGKWQIFNLGDLKKAFFKNK